MRQGKPAARDTHAQRRISANSLYFAAVASRCSVLFNVTLVPFSLARTDVVRRVTSFAIVLLSVTALEAGNSRAQSDSHKAVVDLTAQALQPEIERFSVDSLTITQPTEQLVSPAGPKKEPDIHYVPTPRSLWT